MKILVTGAAGFIGFHLCKKLSQNNNEVTGIDNLNDYYDVNLKLDRLKQLERNKNFNLIRVDIKERESIAGIFSDERFDVVVNLAAQAGVRYSLKNPHALYRQQYCGFPEHPRRVQT